MQPHISFASETVYPGAIRVALKVYKVYKELQTSSQVMESYHPINSEAPEFACLGRGCLLWECLMSSADLEALLIGGALGSGAKMPTGLQSLGRGVSVTASVAPC